MIPSYTYEYNNMVVNEAEIYNYIEDLLNPFFEATLYAKSLGILSIKTPRFSINDILKIYKKELYDLVKAHEDLEMTIINKIIIDIISKFKQRFIL